MTKPVDALLSGPGPVVSRGLLYAVTGLLGTAVAWAGCARVESVVAAPGQIAVRGATIQLMPPEDAIVAEVFVTVGDAVEAGAPLLRIDAYRHEMAIARVDDDIEVLRLEEERLQADAAAGRGQLATLQTERETLAEIVDALATRERATRDLVEAGIAPARELDELRDERLRRELALAEAASRDRALRDRTHAAERLAAETGARLRAKHAERDRLRVLVARATLRTPEAGTVSQLAARSAGAKLAPHDVAVTLIPRGRPLLARVTLPNEAVRRVRRGQAVKVELEAYPAARFGRIPGHLDAIDPDADASGRYGAWIVLESRHALQVGLQLEARIVCERRTLLAMLFDAILPEDAVASIGN